MRRLFTYHLSPRVGDTRAKKEDSSVDWYVSSKKQLDSITNRENPQVQQRRRRRRQSNEIRAHRDAFSAYTSSSNGVAEENGIEDEEDPSTVPLIVRDKIKSIILFVMPLMASNVISPLLTMTDTAFRWQIRIGRGCVFSRIGSCYSVDGLSGELVYVRYRWRYVYRFERFSRERAETRHGKKSLWSNVYFCLDRNNTRDVTCVLSRLFALVVGCRKDWTFEGCCEEIRSNPRISSAGCVFNRCWVRFSLRQGRDTITPLMCVSLAAMTNVILDYVTAVTLKQGAIGAAWATSASLYVGAISILQF